MINIIIELLVPIILRMGGERMLKLIKSRMLKNTPARLKIEVPNNHHFIRLGDPEKNISFCVMFTKLWPITLKVNHIDYEIIYCDRVIQRNTYREPKVMKQDDQELRIDLLYHPMESPLKIPELSNKLKISGTATIGCAYGQFTKTFSSKKDLSISYDGNWEDIRRLVE